MVTIKILKPGVNFTPETKVRLLLNLISGITTSKSLEGAFEFVLTEISKVMGWEIADAWMIDQETHELKFAYGFCRDGHNKFFCEESKKLIFNKDKSSVYHVIRKGEAMWVDDFQKLESPRLGLFKRAGIYSGISLPVPAENTILAVFTFYSTKQLKKDEEMTEYLTAVSQQLGIFLRQKISEDELVKAESEARKLSRELKTLNEELEQKVFDRTRKLERINKELSEFTHIVSHDLKAPLRAVSMLSDWIRHDKDSKLSDASSQNLEELTDQMQKMYKMIEDLLAYAKNSTEKLPKEHVQLNEVVQEVIEDIKPPDNIKLNVCPSHPHIMFPKTQLKQVLQNLIDNAVKYNDKANGEINISCKDNPDHWQITVKDNGPGIPEKYKNDVFKLFSKIPSTKKGVDSTGIGLSIVKKTVEKNGGEIWLESKPGEGCAFNFTIPKAG